MLTGAGSRLGKLITQNLEAVSDVELILLTSNPENILSNSATIQVDMCSVDSINKVFHDIKSKYGCVDILINNAAVNTSSEFDSFIDEYSPDRILETMIVNAVAPIICMQNVLGSAKSKSPLIINMLSGRPFSTRSKHIDYFASKAALHNATRNLAKDCPNARFVNLGVPQINFDGDGICPSYVVEEISNTIKNRIHSNYREVFFGVPWRVFLEICKEYFKHLKIVSYKTLR